MLAGDTQAQAVGDHPSRRQCPGRAGRPVVGFGLRPAPSDSQEAHRDVFMVGRGGQRKGHGPSRAEGIWDQRALPTATLRV